MSASNAGENHHPMVDAPERKGWYRVNFYLIHGIVLYVAWGLLAIVMVSSTRYLKGKLWGNYLWIHGIVGGLISAITLYFGA